ncbi:retrovirus-related Pol polyprotein from transposon 297 [Trichonephila clavipes]|nr:retrovirus-related Pol polyprotein from transposon 297 [Trichonephila clavipes]
MLEKVIENWTSRLDYIRASRGSHMPGIIFKIHLQIKQNENIVNKINKYKNERKYSLHINEETYVTPPHSQISEDQNVLPQIVIENRCELREILSHYDSFFSKDKYDVGQLRVEPQRIILKSDLPIHLRPYRTSPIQGKEIKGQVEKLLQAGLIKESTSPYSAPTDECQKAFEKLKESLITKPILHLYDPDLTCHVFVDASQKSVGAVLKQPDASNALHPIAYHSRTLRDYEKNYAITELECLAIIEALDKFYYYLHDRKFLIHTDHAALWLKNVKNLKGRLFRWSLKLNMYDYEIKYFKSSTNIEAYMLPRRLDAHHLQHSSHLLDINEIKTPQMNDNLCGPKYYEVNDVLIKKFLRNYIIKHLLTTAHHSETNGKNERVKQSLVTRLKCKVNALSTKIPWTKLLDQVCNEYNSTPHSITKYPPAYLLFGLLLYQSSIDQNIYYEPVDEARELALQRTIDYHIKNKIRYDAHCIEKKFNPGDLVYEEFQYPNTRKLSFLFSGPYEIIKQCSEVTYEINKPNSLAKKNFQIVHISKLRCFYSLDNLKLSHE